MLTATLYIWMSVTSVEAVAQVHQSVGAIPGKAVHVGNAVILVLNTHSACG
jgi:hypothetical protein